MSFEAPHNEWNELEAAMRSEVELARIMREGAGKVTARELELARRDAMRAMVTGLPDPRDVARALETADPEAAEVLKQAWISSKQPYAGAWRVIISTVVDEGIIDAVLDDGAEWGDA